MLLLVAAYYFSMMRAANACILPVLTIYLLVLEFKGWQKRELSHELATRRRGVSIRVLLICFMCAGFLFFYRESIVAERWKLELMNTLQRNVFAKNIGDNKIIFNERFFKYFVEKHNMPAREAFLHLGRKRWEPPDEPTPAYDAWLSQQGYGAYMDFLVNHPRWVFHQYANIGILYSFDGLWDIAQWNGWKEGFDIGRIIKATRIQKLYLHTVGLLVHLRYSYLIMNLLFIFLVIWWNRAYTDRERTLICPEVLATLVILFYVAPVIAIIAWLGDEDSPLRHSLVGMVSYYLGAIILFWIIMDWLVQRHSLRGAGKKCAPHPHERRPPASGSV